MRSPMRFVMVGLVLFSPLCLGDVKPSGVSGELRKPLKQEVAATLSLQKKLSEESLQFSWVLFSELSKGLDSAPRTFKTVLAKGEGEMKRLTAQDSPLGELDACGDAIKRSRESLEKLLISRSFGEAASLQILKAVELENQIEAIKSTFKTSSRRLDSALRFVRDWERLFLELETTLGRPQAVSMIRGFVEREIQNEQAR